MDKSLRILVAAAGNADAEAAAAPLRADFDDIACSTDPQRHVADFDAQRAPLCVLAFARLAQAEQYLIRLERSSESLHAFAHRRLVLCRQDETPLARALCQQGRFDDYVQFWPAPADAQRLPMAAHHAACALIDTAARTAQAKAWVEEADRLAQLESRLAASGAWVLERADETLRALDAARSGIAADTGADELSRGLAAAATTLGWMRHWALRLQDEWQPELDAAKRLAALAGRARPVILAIDDDEFQHKLLRRLLGDQNVELLSATSVGDAMAILQLRRPDCILMDIGLPDMDGIDAVRMIKSVRSGESIRIVMLTGSRDETALERSLDAGAGGFIAKPFNRAMLLARLRAVLPDGPVVR